MTITRHHVGERFALAVDTGQLVFTNGQVADAPKGADTKDQTAQVLHQIDRLLEEAGTDKRRIVNATIWLADLKDLPQMNAAWDAWLDRQSVPARACVGAQLANPDWKVEIAVVATK
ncbi:MAG: RidA family protein [Reyranella sp.]|jgi:enamine deaminase RidA (YjgF/YER057c/UK114 family)|uniref:RidA family protein n=1 Tax=Reyranella sp. TaxID=1929291 RepID=UPI00095AAF77|nr:RidA family protein [Reyranella sp.]MBR2817566.1 RidA family protein [Reyranella sp.]OJU31054.1 MAG: hypothetical protein BGN99_12755 [Alphaproteobacteria bacterium 65-37]